MKRRPNAKDLFNRTCAAKYFKKELNEVTETELNFVRGMTRKLGKGAWQRHFAMYPDGTPDQQ